MILVHSVFGPLTANPDDAQLQSNGFNERIAKYLGYQAACVKYNAEIAAIQKFFPGWLPNPPSNK
jgi:hypothetical protein